MLACGWLQLSLLIQRETIISRQNDAIFFYLAPPGRENYIFRKFVFCIKDDDLRLKRINLTFTGLYLSIHGLVLLSYYLKIDGHNYRLSNML